MSKSYTKCGVVKPLDEFHRFANARDGHRTECKTCACERARAKYDRSRWDTGEVSGTCAYCGESFTYIKSTGQRRKYCSERCRYFGCESMKRNRAQLSTRACACGSTEVAKVGMAVCPACRKDPRSNGQNRVRERRRLLRLYNVTQADWDRMVASQGDRCAICRTDRPGGRGESWSIDHDHRCCADKGSCGRCVRGLLCTNCNLSIGYAKDDPDLLRAQAAYIEAARQPPLFGVSLPAA